MLIARHPRLIIFVALALTSAGAEWYFLRCKVPTILPASYAKYATDLKVTAAWRYGADRTIHGCWLVRTPNSGQSSPATRANIDAGTIAQMRRELRLVPLKALVEWALYLMITGLMVFLPALFERVRHGARASSGRRFLQGASITALAWAVAVTPLGWYYGVSVYSTYAGPGFVSYSGPYLRVTWKPADTVSYRAFMELAGLPPLLILEKSGILQRLGDVPVYLILAATGLIFYAPIGGAARMLAGRLRLSRARHSAIQT